MGRGLDGFFVDARWRCAVLKDRRRSLEDFRWFWRGGNTSSHSEQSS
jgi:hypothetical protein